VKEHHISGASNFVVNLKTLCPALEMLHSFVHKGHKAQTYENKMVEVFPSLKSLAADGLFKPKYVRACELQNITTYILFVKKLQLVGIICSNSLMKQQFVITHIIRLDEIPALRDPWVTKILSVKMLCP
jgi:hypothetical protein